LRRRRRVTKGRENDTLGRFFCHKNRPLDTIKLCEVLMDTTVLSHFHPAVAAWFSQNYPGGPTPPQAAGWPLIATGKNVLLLAPTGSGKTLAAFLKCLDWLYRELEAGREAEGGVKVLYISPLKALNNDIARNLEQPLAGIETTGRELGLSLPQIRTAVRTGDTPSSERQRMVRRPPHILITTPESFFLMLSSQARKIFAGVRFVIVDEIHTLFPTKRGAHLALSLARLQHLVGEDHPLQRIGLSATMRPLEGVAAYLGGFRDDPEGQGAPRSVEIVDTGQRKDLDLRILLPVPDLRELPEKSIWPPVYQQLLDLIREHRTTLIFVNNRRLAERITVNLNQMAGAEIALTHHGSVSREMRHQAESLLKEGKIPCIVATASLELGIDIGYIDLVVQVETPKEVARGLQRVGRAGHVVGMPSKGRIIPKTRGDLLESAAIIREMKAGRVEPSKAIINCLDILAQQIVALTGEGNWPVRRVFRLVRTAYNFHSLSWKDFENVLKMLAGNYETTEFVDLRPRIYWDKTVGVIKPDSYGKRLIYSSGGTIPDRGYYGVYLQNTSVRLGELDEEFVYERRLNERFVLGTSVWRIEEIRQDRVIVSPTRKTGEAIIPFWKAEQPGRPFELGKRIGAFMAEAEGRLGKPELRQWLQNECFLEPETADNIIRYLEAQKASVGFLQTDHRLVVEEFPDEAGEWRVLLHSTFGWKFHLALGILIKDRWEQEHQINVEAIPGDDGIMFHLPGGVKPPEIDWAGMPLDGLEERIAALIADTPLFGVTFRHAAQISMVMPRTGYGRKRTPFWLSRLKAGNLLHTVSKYPDFPLVIETYRAVLQDHLEIAALREVLLQIRYGALTIQRCQHQTPSPFAGAHLFNFVGSFMYEGETPKSEAKNRLFGLGRDALKTFLGEAGFRNLLDPAVIAAAERKARGDELLEEVSEDTVRYWLERIGDVTVAEVEAWFPDSADRIKTVLQSLAKRGQVAKITIPAGRELMISASEIGHYHAVFPSETGTEERRDGREAAGQWLIQRFVRNRGIFQTQDIADRYHLSETEVAANLSLLAADGIIAPGEYRPGGTGEEWCDSNLLEEIRRRSLAQSRRAAETVGPERFAAFLCDWQGVGSERGGLDGLYENLRQLRGLWLPAEVWEQSVLPGRTPEYRRTLLDQLIASGQVYWRGRGNPDNIEVCLEMTGPEPEECFPQPPFPVEEPFSEKSELPLTAVAEQLREVLRQNGALSLPRILQATRLSTIVAWQALEELILRGVVTNDSYGPVRYLLNTGASERTGARGVLKPSVMAQMGRWSLLPRPESTLTGRIMRLFNRYGLVCREIVRLEGDSWSEIYPILDFWENLGHIRRGYYVTGLSGIQYILPSALEQLNAPTGIKNRPYQALSHFDPVNPFRIFPEWEPEHNLIKPWGDYTVWESGRPILGVSGGKKKLRLKNQTELTETQIEKALQALLRSYYPVRPDEKIVITYWNDEPVSDCRWVNILERLGFERGYQEMTLWPSRRRR
jgi:ATP-dependent Lhr-like helicase